MVIEDLDELRALCEHGISLNECDLATAVPGLLDEIDRLGKLVVLHERYELFLSDANEGPIGMAYVHGWSCPQKDIEQGERFRQEIAELARVKPMGRNDAD